MHPSEHKTFESHLFTVGPTSSKLNQHRINVVQMFFFVDWFSKKQDI